MAVEEELTPNWREERGEMGAEGNGELD